MFENPGGKLRAMYKACLYVLLAAAEILLAVVFLPIGEGWAIFVWIVLAGLVWFIWWVYGLRTLMEVDQANNVYEIKCTVDRIERNLAKNGTPVRPAPIPEPVPPRPKAEEQTNAEEQPARRVKYCHKCGKQQFVGNRVCPFCNTPLW